jgi:hypothetical protein
VEGIVAIISAVFCCGAVCCGGGQNRISSGSVRFKPQEFRSNEQGGGYISIPATGSSAPGAPVDYQGATTGIVNEQQGFFSGPKIY